MATTNDEIIVRVAAGEPDETPRLPVDQLMPPGRTTKITIAELQALIGSGGGGGDYALFQEQQATSVNAGTFTSGAWRTRLLNTEVVNEISGASLASNQLTLPAGDYVFLATAPVLGVQRHQTRLQNITAGSTIEHGDCLFADTAACDSASSRVFGKFTLGVSSVIELQHQCSATKSGNGFGNATTFSGTTEVYSRIELLKTA